MTEESDGVPVPVITWHVPAARPGEAMSPPMARRLLAQLTSRRQVVLDLTRTRHLARTAASLRCRYTAHTAASVRDELRPAALIVVGWPLPGTDPVLLLTDCAARLRPGCPIAVVRPTVDLLVNQTLIAVAQSAGLTYSGHIVGARNTTTGPVVVHSDILLFSRSAPPQPQ